MKGFILASLLVVAVSASLLEEHAKLFQEYKLKHGKTYLNQAEETKRFAIFRDNLAQIAEHNAKFEAGVVSYKKAINKFSDLTHEEFKDFLKLHSAHKPQLNATKYVKIGAEVPESVDWRQQGQVTAIKDQGNCGSCWAFALVATTEAAYFRKSGQLVSLSEQQLVDCATDVNFGCDGGYLDQNYPYLEKTGLQSEASYPYTAVDGTCQFDASKVVTKVSSYIGIQEDEDALKEAVALHGPVAVAIDASYLSPYESGVYDDEYCSKFGLNHGVTVVGYGAENGKDYWIVKNSWGSAWGEEGYFLLARGKNACGVTEDDVLSIIN